MQFNSHADEQDIVHRTWFLTGADTNSYTLKDIAASSNEALSRMACLALMAAGRMQWDDVNHGNQPIATFNLSEDISTYTILKALPTALQDWLEIERIEVLDEAGNGILLKPIDHRNIKVAMSEFMKTSGIPEYFDVNGNELKILPAPNYDKVAGATIYFDRAPSFFASTDTTKKPGFASVLCDYIPKYNAMQWFFKNDQMGRYDRLKLELKGNNPFVLGGMEKDIVNFYSRRTKFERPKITRNQKSKFI